jgi:glucose-6-phosphate 1-dehydrogenase
MNSPDNLPTNHILSQAPKKPATSCVLIIFGATGDLTKRLLLPAICNLGAAGLLNENFTIVAIARRSFTDEEFRNDLTPSIAEFVTDEAAKKYAQKLIKQIYYVAGTFEDANTYDLLAKKLASPELNSVDKNYLFYFAVPPDSMQTIANELSKTDLLKEENSNFRRLVVEKPFGHDLESAKKLNAVLTSAATEKQIYIIDHFLGKEVVQNILALRFANSLFENNWNKSHIDHVQITVAETLGVETRGDFYEHSGALRDMITNHLLQMLSLIAMEPAADFSVKAIWDAKLKALKAVQILTAEEVEKQVVRGQYGAGQIDNKAVIGYREEDSVARDSVVETFVALKLFVNNARWSGVPFYLRTGKRMAAHTSEIIVQFKPDNFPQLGDNKTLPNVLTIYIQPDAGISLRINTKVPGPAYVLRSTEMKFKYSDYFTVKSQTGYETILFDCMQGNHLLFNHADMVETGWQIVQPILLAWDKQAPTDFPNYASGSFGPVASDQLLLNDGRKWLL